MTHGIAGRRFGAIRAAYADYDLFRIASDDPPMSNLILPAATFETILDSPE